MNRELDWPVERAAVAVVSASEVETAFRGGVSGADQFEVASVTKLMTTLAALAAVESGRIGLDDPVPGANAGVTVRHLLAHAGGFPSSPPARPSPQSGAASTPTSGSGCWPRRSPTPSGLSFVSWLATSVLDPLGMSATRLVRRHGVDDDPSFGAASTLDDLIRLASCLLERGAPVIGPELFAEATAVQFPGLAGVIPGIGRFDPCDWGLGFELHDGKHPHWMGRRRSPAAFGHFGATGCFLWVDPAVGLAAAAVTDRDFVDDKWAMATWPAWSDSLPAAGP